MTAKISVGRRGPEGRDLLITRSTGTGKTVFANEFLYRGITDYNDNGVYLTFENHPIDIIKNKRNFGWVTVIRMYLSSYE